MTTQRIAELEAEVLRLRDVVFDIAGEEPSFSWRKANDELSTPFTATALNELIEKVERRTIERCAGVVYRKAALLGGPIDQAYLHECAAAIRKLGERE